MSLWIYDLLLYISWISYLSTIVVLIYFKGRRLDKVSKLLLLFLIVGLLTELLGELFYVLYLSTNLMVYLYTLIIGPILALMYIHSIHHKLIKKILYGYMGLHVLYGIINFAIEPKLIMDDKLGTYLIIFFFLVNIFYMFETFLRMEVPDLKRHFFFWINSGLMVYFGTSIVVNIFSSVVRSDMLLFVYLWPIQLIATMLLNTILIIGIWKTRRI